eukprot:6489678-Amphidinium_carterae.2
MEGREREIVKAVDVARECVKVMSPVVEPDSIECFGVAGDGACGGFETCGEVMHIGGVVVVWCGAVPGGWWLGRA